jgi:hypothetical protein
MLSIRHMKKWHASAPHRSNLWHKILIGQSKKSIKLPTVQGAQVEYCTEEKLTWNYHQIKWKIKPVFSTQLYWWNQNQHAGANALCILFVGSPHSRHCSSMIVFALWRKLNCRQTQPPASPLKIGTCFVPSLKTSTYNIFKFITLAWPLADCTVVLRIASAGSTPTLRPRLQYSLDGFWNLG